MPPDQSVTGTDPRRFERPTNETYDKLQADKLQARKELKDKQAQPKATPHGVGVAEQQAHEEVVENKDNRTPPQIDIDRILYSSAFRRLSGVTQIRSPDGTSVVHNRQLHSLKVAQLARAIGSQRQFIELGVDPDICYAAGMAHDLGHPPFGHAGERMLQDILDGRVAEDGTLAKDRKPINIGGFEGNAQSFRIVCKTSARKTDEWASHLGMRLTLGTLAAIAKYPWQRNGMPPSKSHIDNKWGAYNTEVDQLQEAILAVRQDSLYLDDRSLEAQIMDYADDVAYAVGDVEDYYRVGMVDFSNLNIRGMRISFLGLMKHLSANDQERWGPPWNPQDRFAEFFGYAYRRIVDWAVKQDEPDLPPREIPRLLRKAFTEVGGGQSVELPIIPYDGSSYGKMIIHRYTSHFTELFLNSCEFRPDCGLYVPPQVRVQIELLKKLASYSTYDHPSIRMRQRGQTAALRQCFFAFYDVCNQVFEFDKSTLPSEFKKQTHFSMPGRLYEYCLLALEEAQKIDPANKPYSAIGRAVCDYLCTLTDHTVLAIAEALRGGNGDILDHLDTL